MVKKEIKVHALSKVIRRELPHLLPRLRRFAYGLTGTMDTADDLVQAACERALRQDRNWSEHDHVDRWMFRTIRNLHVDQLRHHQTTERLRGKMLGDLPTVEDGSATFEHAIRLSEVGDAVSTLSEEQRSVMMLICVEGFSYREVSEILNLPIGTVTSRLARGRTQVLEILESNTGLNAEIKKIADGN